MDGNQAIDIGNADTATVPVFATDTEAPMVGQERWEQICQLYHVEGMNISQIARVCELDRKTVRRCVRKSAWRAYQRQAARS